jgi:hypothetical protein
MIRPEGTEVETPSWRVLLPVAVPLVVIGVLSIALSYVPAIASVGWLSDTLREIGSVLVASTLAGLFVEAYFIGKGLKSRTNEIESIHDRAQMYERGTEIVKSDADEVIIFQRTPTLLLGARLKEEKDFEAACIDRIEKVKNDPHRRTKFYYLFSVEETREEIGEKQGKGGVNTSLTPEQVKRKVNELKSVEDETDGRFIIEGADGHLSGPLAVSNTGFMIWMAQHASRQHDILLVTSSRTPSGIPDKLKDIAVAKTRSADELCRDLGLV